MIEAMATEVAHATKKDVGGEIFCYATVYADDDKYDHDDPLLIYKAVSDPDTMYFNQAMKENDSEEFRTSMTKEIKDQFENGNFTVVPRTEVPEGQTVIPAVWQMRRKRNAKTGAIKKYKACLNVDGSQMRKGEHYERFEQIIQVNLL